MSRSQRAKWWNTAAIAGGGILLASSLFLLGYVLPGVLVLAACGALAWLSSSRRAPQTSRHWEAQERLVREGRVIIYWRPGCMFCTRLRWRLGPLGRRATWVDIWSDPEAAAFVRDVNDGAETVPTVILSDGEAHTNPDPALVRAHLDEMSQAA